MDLFLEHLLRLHNQCEQCVTLKSICFLSSTLTFHLAKSKWWSTANWKPPPWRRCRRWVHTTQHVAESVMPSFSAVLYFKFWFTWLTSPIDLFDKCVCLQMLTDTSLSGHSFHFDFFFSIMFCPNKMATKCRHCSHFEWRLNENYSLIVSSTPRAWRRTTKTYVTFSLSVSNPPPEH